MTDTYELPPMPQACDITPVSWSNLYSADQMREYARAAIQQDRARRQALPAPWAALGDAYVISLSLASRDGVACIRSVTTQCTYPKCQCDGAAAIRAG
jgi:hypothetical protein